ncbi:MAG: hypothetical protein P8Y69_01440 [Gammaproteobacteria bacterium]|jgi:tetratricopeptide (TPR) repeat protein
MSSRSLAITFRAFTAVVAVWLAAPAAAATARCEPTVASHPCATEGLARCQATVSADPYALEPRIALCDAYLAADDLLKALVTIQQGLDLCGSDRSNCQRLRVAMSNIQELAEKQTPDEVEERAHTVEVLRGYCLGPSASDASIEACLACLADDPNAQALHSALGDKYLRRGLSGRAVIAYRKAASLGRSAELDRAMADAEQLRRGQVGECLEGNLLLSCDSAILPGSSDEVAIQHKRGLLLSADGRGEAALEALLVAQSLAPMDAAVAASMLELLDSDAAAVSRNPGLRLAKAEALLAAGWLTDALLAYREVPERLLQGDVLTRLDGARSQRRREIAAGCLERQDLDAMAACRDLLVAGLPDAGDIRSHIADLEALHQAPPPKPPPVEEPVDEPEPPTVYTNVAVRGVTH